MRISRSPSNYRSAVESHEDFVFLRRGKLYARHVPHRRAYKVYNGGSRILRYDRDKLGPVQNCLPLERRSPSHDGK